MNKQSTILTCEQARELDMVEYLSSLGFEAQKIRRNDYWYVSPLRDEKTASFKINRKLNRWYDHGMGRGGNLVDFGVLFHRCTISELLQALSGSPSFHQQPLLQKKKLADADEVRVILKEVKTLHSLVLIRYLHSRKIPLKIAERFCKEVNFEMNGKSYYTIGFANDLGGYELRNAFCKNSSAPKSISTIKNGSEKIAVLEGFFDFLSLATILSPAGFLKWDYCILNSLSFFEKTKPFLEQYGSIHLFLDNDKAGQNCSSNAVGCGTKYRDESKLYHNYKDLNEWHMAIGKKGFTPPANPP